MVAGHGTAAASIPTRPPTADAEFDAALDRIPALHGKSRSVEEMPGGLTNRIYKVVPIGADPIVVRISGTKTPLLSIDRVAECANSRSAADAGVGPKVLSCQPDVGIAAVEWIEGKTFTAADLDDSRRLARVGQLCRKLHESPRFVNEFDMFAVQRQYLSVVEENGFRIPARYRDFMPLVERIRAALAAAPLATVPCHNDLLAANIMDDGARLWFIDYEYSGNNDPCFELGNIWSEAALPPERLGDLLSAYFETVTDALLARARLLALMSQYGWTLWASIQDAVGTADFDFWTWGMEKYERAVAQFDDHDLARLIQDAGHVNQPRRS